MDKQVQNTSWTIKPRIILTLITGIVLIIGAVLAWNFNQKPLTATVKIDEQSINKTIQISMQDTLSITLINPGDGGYIFSNPKLDKHIVSFVKHTRDVPEHFVGSAGNFGQDTWYFKPKKSGQTTITITEKQPWNSESAITNSFYIIVTK